MSQEKNFPNGFDSWKETFFQVSTAIQHNLDLAKKPSNRILDAQFSGGCMEVMNLASTLTDQFELVNKGREWYGEFFDEIDEFLKKNL